MKSAEIITVLGARPQFIKAAVVSRAVKDVGLTEAIVHTGQHYDETMSGQFLAQLGIETTANLAVGSGPHAHQTAQMMAGLQDFLDALPSAPRAVLVYGDTNSTVAAGLVASKLGISLIHVEAGLRSYNRSMPEEVNRVIVDHLSDLLFCSSQVGVENLAKEGLKSGVHQVGDVMLDAFQVFSNEARKQFCLSDLMETVEPPFVLATIHRPSNTDAPDRLRSIVDQLGQLGMPVVWPVHPRNAAILTCMDLPRSVHLIDPVGYFQMLSLLDACDAVVTDSGGVQKEAHWAQRPCITVRDETEWTETLAGGWNQLFDPKLASLAQLLHERPRTPWRMLYGDGKAADRIAKRLGTLF